ncbi:hypothetical protein BsIDN1_23350 [Bacillus safensis]|uniref:Uncharacterized protein n=1 Tax=Bacillus safensis TaxID=561879 RepID=A0A5S9M5D0_BACIA|nr:hypothetical protein BsIDN1_23350 [Bacillus safensis]
MGTRKGWSAVTLTDGTIEGGDVLVDQKRVFVGTSKRTSSAAIYQLKKNCRIMTSFRFTFLLTFCILIV